jgi:lysophospholipase L1-like esterase
MYTKLSIILTTILLLGISCNNSNDPENQQKKSEYTYLALGDSYTIGEKVDTSNRFPVQLADTLISSGINVKETKIVAKTGWTTDDLIKGIQQAELRETYDLVTLLIGVNNQYQGKDVENYRPEFRELLKKAIDFAGDDPEKVVVLSIPDWGVTPFAESRDRETISAEIDEYNRVNKKETQQAGVSYVNITPISRKAENNPGLIAEDGLHPSGKMYSMWVDKMFTDAKRAITTEADND